MNFKFLKGIIFQFAMFISLVPRYILYKLNLRKCTASDVFKTIQRHSNNSLKSIGVTVTVEGKENLPEQQNVLFVANHSSWADGFIMISAIDRPTGMIIAKEAQWEKFKFIDRWLKLSNCLYIDRSSARAGLKTIKEGTELLKNTSSIGVFPEGKVTLSDELSEFKYGVFRMAQNSNVPIVPLVIINSKDIYKPKSRWIGKVYSKDILVKILPPVKEHIDNSSMNTKKYQI